LHKLINLTEVNGRNMHARRYIRRKTGNDKSGGHMRQAGFGVCFSRAFMSSGSGASIISGWACRGCGKPQEWQCKACLEIRVVSPPYKSSPKSG
jgi:hypothetical protein